MLFIREKTINLAIFSLKNDLLSDFSEKIEKLTNQLELEFQIEKILLKKNELQNSFKLKKEFDGCILLHKSEGRLLLVDKNGLYNNLIPEIISKSNNLEESENKIENSDNLENKSNIKNELFNTNKIKVLATEGGQPFLELLCKNLKILTVYKDFNKEQINFLLSFLYKCLYRNHINLEKMNLSDKVNVKFQIQNNNKFRNNLIDNLLENYKEDNQIVNELQFQKIYEENNLCLLI